MNTLKGFGQLESITPDLPYWVLRETAKSDAIWPSSIMCTVSIRRGEISTVWRCAGRWWWWLLWRLASSGVWDKKKSEVSGRVAPRPSPACHVSTGHLAARTGDGTHARRCHAPHGGALRRGGAGKPIAEYRKATNGTESGHRVRADDENLAHPPRTPARRRRPV